MEPHFVFERAPKLYISRPKVGPIVVKHLSESHFSQTTLCLGLLFYTLEQDENTYRKSKHGSPTDDVVKAPITNIFFFFHISWNGFFFMNKMIFVAKKSFVCGEAWFWKVWFGGSRPFHRVDGAKLMVNSLSFIEHGLNGVELWQCLVWYRSKTVKKYEFTGHARM